MPMQVPTLLVALMSCISNEVLVILTLFREFEAVDGRIGRLMAIVGDGGNTEGTISRTVQKSKHPDEEHISSYSQR